MICRDDLPSYVLQFICALCVDVDTDPDLEKFLFDLDSDCYCALDRRGFRRCKHKRTAMLRLVCRSVSSDLPLTHVVVGEHARAIPRAATNLVFLKKFNQPLQPLLPPDVESILFVWASCFNQELNLKGFQLKELALGYEYNQALDELPGTLQSLFPGGKYLQPLTHVPDSLQCIKLRYRWGVRWNLYSELGHCSKMQCLHIWLDKLPQEVAEALRETFPLLREVVLRFGERVLVRD